jgi:hypothetical protein
MNMMKTSNSVHNLDTSSGVDVSDKLALHDTDHLAKSMNHLTIDFKVVDCSGQTTNHDTTNTNKNSTTTTTAMHLSASAGKMNTNLSPTTSTSPINNNTNNVNKSKSMGELGTGNNASSGGNDSPVKKLVSPYGDWCGFRLEDLETHTFTIIMI